ncbi:hypothetical protein, partial [Alistipes indistinctus]|uniref:hypothetical protein n=1 Tax=Alistipes indistinctus TaxID=626932 RepID=UPI0024945DC0
MLVRTAFAAAFLALIAARLVSRLLLAYPPKSGAKQQKSCKNTGVAFVDISGSFHNLHLLYLLVDFIVVVSCYNPNRFGSKFLVKFV